MRIITTAMLLTLSVIPISVLAADMVGEQVLIEKGALVCDYFHLEKSIILYGAGDEASIRKYIKDGYCLQTSEVASGVVVNDTQTLSGHSMVEVVISGESMWVIKNQVAIDYATRNRKIAAKKAKEAEVAAAKRAKWEAETPQNVQKECERSEQQLVDIVESGDLYSREYFKIYGFIDSNCQ